MEGLHLSLQTDQRCQPTGGERVCIGHWDYYSAYMVWTRHARHFPVRYKIVPYDHPAPETVRAVSLN